MFKFVSKVIGEGGVVAIIGIKYLQLWKMVNNEYQRVIGDTITLIEVNVCHFLCVEMVRIGKEANHMSIFEL